MIDQIKTKVSNNIRINDEEALYLYRDLDLLTLGKLAQEKRFKLVPNNSVSFVIDTNLNYTNICDAYCSFCAFYRTDPDDPSSYTYSVDEMIKKIRKARDKGCTTILMQGGLNSDIPFEFYTEIVTRTVNEFPDITPHFFSAPEIMKMSEVSGLTVKEVFLELKKAGQRTMPGGGSEILTNEIKSKISRFKPKNSVDQWTDVHRNAHEVGIYTTATMMYGHLEKDKDIIETLSHIRTVQDESIESKAARFTAFIPWSFKKDNTALGKKIKKEAGPNQYLRIIALSRLYLDNINHIQASWFSEGYKTGQIALSFGADDFGGTLFDENVMLSAGFYNRTSVEGIKKLINDAGFEATQRTTEYDLIEEMSR
ncbi:MAG: CofH family radical SAM protein [Dehalococcoidia bacterium]